MLSWLLALLISFPLIADDKSVSKEKIEQALQETKETWSEILKKIRTDPSGVQEPAKKLDKELRKKLGNDQGGAAYILVLDHSLNPKLTDEQIKDQISAIMGKLTLTEKLYNLAEDDKTRAEYLQAQISYRMMIASRHALRKTSGDKTIADASQEILASAVRLEKLKMKDLEEFCATTAEVAKWMQDKPDAFRQLARIVKETTSKP